LIIATEFGNEEAVNLLLKMNADTEAELKLGADYDSFGDTSLVIAATKGNTNIIRIQTPRILCLTRIRLSY